MLGSASGQRDHPPVDRTDLHAWPFGFIVVPGQPLTPGNPAMEKVHAGSLRPGIVEADRTGGLTW